jgi:hypothetical protein
MDKLPDKLDLDEAKQDMFDVCLNESWILWCDI